MSLERQLEIIDRKVDHLHDMLHHLVLMVSKMADSRHQEIELQTEAVQLMQKAESVQKAIDELNLSKPSGV